MAGEGPDADTIDLAAGEVVEGVDITLATDCEPPAVTPRLQVSVTSARPGEVIDVTGENFQPGETVRLELHSTPMPLGQLTADAAGRIAGSVTIPTNVPAGAHHVVAIGASSAFEASVALTVIPLQGGAAPNGESGDAEAGAALAATGAAAPTILVAVALGLLVLGGFLTRRSVFSRR
ncbi:hypothetical protein [Microbacterium sp. CIAB417]|uniref:hypothetical protein n=1 Tax=Microbacterium sp. CIAB417 TaxID=2860287 RepID=UPI001FADFDE1|nr:hypothetical protein [Microbacterium sp. CIAB417]